MSRRTWTDEQLVEAVRESTSLAEVMRRLGLRCHGGGSSFRKIKWHIVRLGLDTTHMFGQAANRGERNKGGPRKPHFSEVLARKHKLSAHALRKAALAAGLPYRCECGNEGSWQDRPLTLQLDHKDGDRTNNTLSNLRFLCPNCHAQTPT
jgi:hypothetical protein